MNLNHEEKLSAILATLDSDATDENKLRATHSLGDYLEGATYATLESALEHEGLNAEQKVLVGAELARRVDPHRLFNGLREGLESWLDNMPEADMVDFLDLMLRFVLSNFVWCSELLDHVVELPSGPQHWRPEERRVIRKEFIAWVLERTTDLCGELNIEDVPEFVVGLYERIYRRFATERPTIGACILTEQRRVKAARQLDFATRFEGTTPNGIAWVVWRVDAGETIELHNQVRIPADAGMSLSEGTSGGTLSYLATQPVWAWRRVISGCERAGVNARQEDAIFNATEAM